MSSQGETKRKVTITMENSTLQAAAKQSVILPADAMAKAKTTSATQDPAPSTSAIQKATQQCASLPKNREVICESLGKSENKS